MATSQFRGHTIIYMLGQWIYRDTLDPVARNERTCGNCCASRTEDGHDPCLGELPDVMNACCGHGIDKEAYVQFLDGSVSSRDEALRVIEEKKSTRDRR